MNGLYTLIVYTATEFSVIIILRHVASGSSEWGGILATLVGGCEGHEM